MAPRGKVTEPEARSRQWRHQITNQRRFYKRNVSDHPSTDRHNGGRHLQVIKVVFRLLIKEQLNPFSELMQCFNCVFAFSSTAQCRPCLHIPCLAITFKLTQPVYSPVTHPHTRVWYQVRSPSIPYTELTKTWWNSIYFIPSLIVVPKLSLFECKKNPCYLSFSFLS